MRALLRGRGFDVVFDATGGSDPSAAFAAARVRGRVVTIVTAFTADLTPLHMKGLSLHAVFMLIPMLHDSGREAHGAILRIYEKKPLVADQVAVNYRKADITPRQRAMLDFAMKVCTASDQVEDADFAALHAHGFDDEDIWDITAITAFLGLSNRMASVTGMMPNPEFYLMGRVPREKK